MVVALALAFAGYAQRVSGRYICKHYTIENGLPQSSAKKIVLDRNGLLWIATQGGLCYFDGTRFVNYTSANSILPGDRILSLTIDAKGIVKITLPYPDNVLYYIDAAYRLRYDSLFNRQPAIIFHNGEEPVPFPEQLTLKDRRNNTTETWYGSEIWKKDLRLTSVSDHEVYYADGDTLKWVDLEEHSITSAAVLPGWRGNLLVNGKLLSFGTDGNWVLLDGPVQKADLKVTESFRKLFVRLKGATNICYSRNNTSATALLRLHNEVWQISMQGSLLDARLIFDGLDAEQYYDALLYDEAGRILFAGTSTDGLYVYRIIGTDFGNVSIEGESPWHSSTYSLLQLNSREMINNQFRFDPRRLAWKSVPYLSFPFLSGLYRTADSRIWLSGIGKLIVTDTLLSGRHIIPLSADRADQTVLSFAEDENHTLWLGTLNALAHLQQDTLIWSTATAPYFAGNRINLLFAPGKDQLWIGGDKGIAVYDKKSDRVTETLLPGNTIRHIFRAKDESIWVCTYGKGIYKYSGGKFVPLPLDAGSNLLFAHSIFEDDRGFFWIPTNNGLFQCRKDELDAWVKQPGEEGVYYYQYKNISRSDEYNGGGSPPYALFENLLLLPSIKGIVVLDPKQLKPLLPNSSILIEYIRVDTATIVAGSRLMLPPGFQRLEIGISAPYFGDAINNILEYRLRETGARWYPLSNGKLVYNRLPKGVYHIDLRKRTGFGAGNYAYRTIIFSVKPFWYQTTWFLLAIVAGVAGIVYLLVKVRLRSLQKAKQQLEEKVEERTGQLTATVAELNASERELSRVNEVQEQALAIILHDIRSPLNYLSVSARYFNKNIDELTMEEIRQYTQSLVISTSSIDKFSNDLVQWLSVHRSDRKRNDTTFSLPVLLEEIYTLYDEIARLNSNTLSLECVGTGHITADRNKLFLVLRNLVDNANKHCREGHITLSAHRRETDSSICITVADTGSGMSAEELLKWQHVTPQAPDFKKDKLGLNMVHYFVQLMNGHLDIRSEEGSGTRITITLPSMKPEDQSG